MVSISVGDVIVNNGRKILINRLYKATPDYTIPDDFRVGTGTTTPTKTDTDAETQVGSDFNQESGYPALDESSINTTMRGILDTGDVNGNDITEFVPVNTDSPDLAFAHHVITGVTKNSSTRLLFVATYGVKS